jgi:hypothetical protein
MFLFFFSSIIQLLSGFRSLAENARYTEIVVVKYGIC